MHTTTAFIGAAVAALISATAVTARPDRASVCSSVGSTVAIGSGMGGNGKDLTTVCSWTADKTSYAPGDIIHLSLTGTNCPSSAYQGLLLYAVQGADGSTRMGSFALPAGAQALTSGCTAQSETANSVITHTSSFSGASSFTYTASSNASGDLTFHAIVLEKSGSGFSWGSWDSAVTIKFAARTTTTTTTTTTNTTTTSSSITSTTHTTAPTRLPPSTTAAPTTTTAPYSPNPYTPSPSSTTSPYSTNSPSKKRCKKKTSYGTYGASNSTTTLTYTASNLTTSSPYSSSSSSSSASSSPSTASSAQVNSGSSTATSDGSKLTFNTMFAGLILVASTILFA